MTPLGHEFIILVSSRFLRFQYQKVTGSPPEVTLRSISFVFHVWTIFPITADGWPKMVLLYFSYRNYINNVINDEIHIKDINSLIFSMYQKIIFSRLSFIELRNG